jgi:hypothetical protein
MADNKLLSQMLEHLVNEDQAKAEELFHEYVVAKSREIYENLIETEISEEEKDEDDEEVDEAAKDEDAEDDKVDEASDEDKDDEKMDEEFEDIAIEADDEMGGDATDDLEAELGDEPADAEGEESEEEIMQDLGDIIDELQAKFDALQGEEEEQGEFGDEEGGDMGDEPKMDAFEPELETVREYVEKVPAGHGTEKKGAAEKADGTKSPVAGKNDMGGTTANIAKAQEDGSSKGTAGGLAGNKPKEDNAGNINVPGGKAGNAFSTKEPGHGAEKKGSAEQADNKQSLFRGRR